MMTRNEILSKAKPILFNTEMVRAILDGRKTATRRIVKNNPEECTSKVVNGVCKICDDKGGFYLPNDYVKARSPYNVSDILYVRETFTKYQTVNYIKCYDGRAFSEISDGQYAYKADGYENIDDLKDCIRLLSDRSLEAVEVWNDKWHPSIHMPKEAARIFLKVTNVRIERLQDCGNPQAKDEGCTCCSQFARLWDSTIKKSDLDKYGWNANPWVWVIEFERID